MGSSSPGLPPLKYLNGPERHDRHLKNRSKRPSRAILKILLFLFQYAIKIKKTITHVIVTGMIQFDPLTAGPVMKYDFFKHLYNRHGTDGHTYKHNEIDILLTRWDRCWWNVTFLRLAISWHLHKTFCAIFQIAWIVLTLTFYVLPAVTGSLISYCYIAFTTILTINFILKNNDYD